MPQADIPNYMWQSIVVLACCCLPGGAVALSYAMKVKPALQRGDVQTAMVNSGKAKSWCIWSGVIGLIVNVIAAISQQGNF